MKCTILCRLVPALVLAGCLSWIAAAADDTVAVKTWKNHNSLASEESMKADWSVVGKGDYRVESKGVHLMKNTVLKSRFQLTDKSGIRFVLTSRNRNFTINVCGEKIELEAVAKAKGYQIDLVRKGRVLEYTMTIEETVTVKKVPQVRTRVTANNKILLDPEKAKLPSRIAFGSHPVGGIVANENQIDDVFFKQVLINGDVMLSDTPGSDEETPAKKPGKPKKP